MKQAVQISSSASRRSSAALLIAVFATSSLCACGKTDDSASVGTRVDQAIVTTQQKADELKAEASKEASQVKAGATEMAKDAKAAVGNATEKLGEKMADAAITTSVNAELAKDKSLSALKIDVDTANGRVALRGTAPSTSARERATSLTMAVKGVLSVDNQLSIEAAKM